MNAEPSPPLTAEEEILVAGSSRRLCFTCNSAKLRPLIILAKEGFPPGDSRHNIVYSHDAIFGCDDCRHGYAERRRHDCFNFEELYDQDQAFPLDGESIGLLTGCLAACPERMAETCDCKVHQSLRESWSSLPAEDTVDFPPMLIHISDADQDRLVIPRVCVEVMWDVPWLVPKIGKWQAHDAKGYLKAEGNFWKGRMAGHWTYWYENGQKKSEGEYLEDLREGKWVEWNERGEVVAELVFRKGNPIKS